MSLEAQPECEGLNVVTPEVSGEERAAAFEAFYRQSYWAAIRFVERRSRNHEDARDVVADAFKILWQKEDHRRCYTQPYFWAICRNILGDKIRAARRHQTASDFAGIQTKRIGDTGQQVSDRIAEALEHLPEMQAEILRLLYWDGMTARGAAEVMGSTEQAVWASASRGRANLKKFLSRGERNE